MASYIPDGVFVLCNVLWNGSDVQWRILSCVKEHVNRKNRMSNPGGFFDSAGRFYLHELHDCCSGIRSPSRAYPFSQNKHGRTLPHVAHEFGVERHIKIVRKISNAYEKYGEEAAIDLLNSPAVKRKLIEVDIVV